MTAATWMRFCLLTVLFLCAPMPCGSMNATGVVAEIPFAIAFSTFGIVDSTVFGVYHQNGTEALDTVFDEKKLYALDEGTIRRIYSNSADAQFAAFCAGLANGVDETLVFDVDASGSHGTYSIQESDALQQTGNTDLLGSTIRCLGLRLDIVEYRLGAIYINMVPLFYTDIDCQGALMVFDRIPALVPSTYLLFVNH